MPQTDRTGLGFNVGNEFDLDLIVNGQVVQELGLIEQTGRKVNATLLEITPTNNFGFIVRRSTFQGFTMDLRLTRQDDTMDDLVDALVNAYHGRAPISLFSGVETIINTSSSGSTVSQWKYANGVLLPGNLGTSKGADRTDDVECAIHFSNRTKIRGGSNAPTFGRNLGL